MRLLNRAFTLALPLMASFVATPSWAASLFLDSRVAFDIQYQGAPIPRLSFIQIPDEPGFSDNLVFTLRNTSATLSQMMNGWAQFNGGSGFLCVRVVRESADYYRMEYVSISPFNTHPTPCRYINK